MIASVADDTTVRVWSLAAVHKKQPCVALLAGEGHQWNLLTVVRMHGLFPDRRVRGTIVSLPSVDD